MDGRIRTAISKPSRRRLRNRIAGSWRCCVADRIVCRQWAGWPFLAISVQGPLMASTGSRVSLNFISDSSQIVKGNLRRRERRGGLSLTRHPTFIGPCEPSSGRYTSSSTYYFALRSFSSVLPSRPTMVSLSSIPSTSLRIHRQIRSHRSLPEKHQLHHSFSWPVPDPMPVGSPLMLETQY